GAHAVDGDLPTARREGGDGPIGLPAVRVDEPGGAEADDAGTPHPGRSLGDPLHDLAHDAAVLTERLVLDPREEGIDAHRGGLGLGLGAGLGLGFGLGHRDLRGWLHRAARGAMWDGQPIAWSGAV